MGVGLGKVLVLGDDTRSFLAVVRSLGRAGIEVHAAPADFSAPALASAFLKAVHYLPFWAAGDAEWLAAFEALLRAERFDLVIPCSEPSLLPMQKHRARLERLSCLAIPDDRSIAVLFDKHATRELASSLGIPVAPGHLACPTDTAPALMQALGSPVVVKPRRSYALETLGVRGRVRVAGTAAALAALLPGLEPGEFVLEGFVPGHGVGVSLLASGGRVLQAFEHHRVRENEAGSYYRVSAPLTPALEQASAAMVAALGYTGVAMFEFRVDPAGGGWVLLEVNARPWGSMPLPVSLGVDFPLRWYRLLVEGVETPPVPYPAGVFGRNLVPDLRSTLSDLKAARKAPLRLLALGAARTAELARLITGRDRHDALVQDDPRPAWREAVEAGRAAAARASRGIGSARRDRARTLRVLRRAVAGRAPEEIRVAVVCQGNICRSPFAAALLRDRLASVLPGVEVRSFGMLPMPGRPTPEYGQESARAYGIDLSPHRSQHLGAEAAQATALFVVFDAVNRRAILQRYPGVAAPLLRLGDFAPGVGEINDPIDRDRPFYEATYAAIARAVDGLAEALERFLARPG